MEEIAAAGRETVDIKVDRSTQRSKVREERRRRRNEELVEGAAGGYLDLESSLAAGGGNGQRSRAGAEELRRAGGEGGCSSASRSALWLPASAAAAAARRVRHWRGERRVARRSSEAGRAARETWREGGKWKRALCTRAAAKGLIVISVS